MNTEMTKLQAIAAWHSGIAAAHGVSEIRIRYGIAVVTGLSDHVMRTIRMDFTFGGVFGFMNAKAVWLEFGRVPHAGLPPFVATLSNTSARRKAPCTFYVEFRLTIDELQEAA